MTRVGTSEAAPESLKFTCPVCQAPEGRPCSTVSGNTRKPVTWFHYGRRPAFGESHVNDEEK